MGSIVDLTGQNFGRLTAVELTDKRTKYGGAIWKCKCICGNETFVSRASLKSGHTLSCGCTRKEKLSEIGKKKAKNVIGQKFGRLTAIEPTTKRSGVHIVWKCVCDCGKENLYVSVDKLANGNTTSCGCLQKEKAKENAPKNIENFKKKHYIAETRMDVIGNKKAFKNSKTGIRGVVFDRGKYRADIQFQKKTYNLGRYFTKEEAKNVREEAEFKLHGHFIKWYNEKFKKKIEE